LTELTGPRPDANAWPRDKDPVETCPQAQQAGPPPPPGRSTTESRLAFPRRPQGSASALLEPHQTLAGGAGWV